MVDTERAKGPVLLVDAGNALFPGESKPDTGQLRRAKFLLQTMGALQTAGLAAGARDLSAGTLFLKSSAAAARVPVLSANLETAGGHHPFAASRVVRVAGLRVALIGASPEGAFAGAPEVLGAPLVPAVVAEARRLRRSVDVVVVLAAAPFNLAVQLAQASEGQVDFILQSHDARGIGSGAALQGQGCAMLPTGDRGRQLGEARLRVRPQDKGPFLDLDEHERIAVSVQGLEQREAEAQTRLHGAPDDATRKALAQTLEAFRTRLAAERQRLRTGPPADGRGFHLKFQMLGPDIQDDPALRRAVEALQPGAFAQPT